MEELCTCHGLRDSTPRRMLSLTNPATPDLDDKPSYHYHLRYGRAHSSWQSPKPPSDRSPASWSSAPPISCRRRAFTPAMGLSAPSERARSAYCGKKLAACIPAHLPQMIKALRIE